MRGTPQKNLDMFKALCGDDALSNVMLTTTMWDSMTDERISRRHEDQLRTRFWQPMLSLGCRMTPFLYTWESAWDIINAFSSDNRCPVQLQVEIVDEKRELSATTAFAVLRKWWGHFASFFKFGRRETCSDRDVTAIHSA